MNELELLAAEAERAKERARRKVMADAQRNKGGMVTPQKEFITPEEYVARRDRMLRRDMSLVKEAKKERIEKSVEEWQKRVGKTFAGATVENPKVHERVARIGDEYGSHKTSLLFHGTMGAGKSWHCYAYLNLAIQTGKVTAGQIQMGTETDILGKIAAGGFKRNDMLDELTNPRNQIYFIDDVGQGYFSREEARTEVWYELIDHVYTHQLTLLITTNLPITDNGLGRWVGKRAYDRLRNIVGPDGIIEPGKVNRREAVAQQNDARYRAAHSR
jgi:DNA replication protein DnaC